MKENKRKTYNFKFVVIGDPNVGKSCLVHRFIFKKFKMNSDHTLGVEFATSRLEFDDCVVNLQLWDTAGQERFRSLARSYYRNAVGMIAVYDITSLESYKSLIPQVEQAMQYSRDDTTFIMVGNKSDLEDSREVIFRDVKRECEKEDQLCVETSAKTGDSVDALFQLLTKEILSKIYNGKIEASSLAGKKLSPQEPELARENYCNAC